MLAREYYIAPGRVGDEARGRFIVRRHRDHGSFGANPVTLDSVLSGNQVRGGDCLALFG